MIRIICDEDIVWYLDAIRLFSVSMESNYVDAEVNIEVVALCNELFVYKENDVYFKQNLMMVVTLTS